MTDKIEEGLGSRPAPPSVPTEQTVWVVLGSSGQWSDWSQWPVCVIADEIAAKDEVARMCAAARQLWADKPSYTYDEASGGYTAGAEEQEWLKRLAALDPGADEYDQPNYTAREVPLRTTAAASQAQDGYEADVIGEVNQAPSPPEKA